MTTEDILRKQAGRHVGYQIRSISTTTLKPEGCGFLRKLVKVPGKISAYLHRHLIAAVYKTRFGGLDDEYYIVVATDGTLFHVDY